MIVKSIMVILSLLLLSSCTADGVYGLAKPEASFAGSDVPVSYRVQLGHPCYISHYRSGGDHIETWKYCMADYYGYFQTYYWVTFVNGHLDSSFSY